MKMNEHWMTKLTIRSAMMLALLAGLSAATPAQAQVVRNFAARYNVTETGDIRMVGNTLLSCDVTLSTDCSAVRNGSGDVVLERNNNNEHAMRYVDVDSDATTFNSSRASYTLPVGAEVLWAGLYWGGRTVAGLEGQAAPDVSARDKVKFSSPITNGYVNLTASNCDIAGNDYHCFVDVTNRIPAVGGGQYAVGNVQLGTGLNRFGGWGLVIVYNDPSQPTRNLVVYDGFANVLRDDMLMIRSVNINVAGFLTPAQGDVITRVGAMVYEGDLDAPGDSFVLSGVKLSDGSNPTDNFFNATNSVDGLQIATKSPNYKNLLGFDLDMVEARNVLANSATTATITLQTTGDTYFPGVVTFATEIYAPRITALKTVTDLDGGESLPGDVLEYTIVVTNTGNDPAERLTIEDTLPDKTTLVPGSVRIDNQVKTEARDADQVEVVAGALTARLGQGATGGQGGSLGTNQTTTLTFQVKINEDVATGDSIQNQASVKYRARTLGRDFTILTDGDMGAAGSSPTVIIVRGSPGMVDILRPEDTSTTNNNRPTISGTAEPNKEVKLTIDGGATITVTADAQGNWSYTPPTALADGGHTVTATSGELATDTHVFEVDTTPPTLTIISPADGSSTSNTTPTIRGTTDPNATVTIVIDGGAPITVTADGQGNWTHTPTAPLSQGPHTVDVTANDEAGNMTSQSVTFTVDAGAPTLTIDSPADNEVTNDKTPTISGTAAPGATVKVTVESTGEVLTTTANAQGAWSVTPMTSLPSGPNTVNATLDGIVNAPVESVTFSVNANSGGLVITSPQPGDITGTTTTVTGTGTPGSTIVITVDGMEIGTTTVGPEGEWSVDVNLPTGEVTITVTSTTPTGEMETATVTITVDEKLNTANQFVVTGGVSCATAGKSGHPAQALWLVLTLGLIGLVRRRRA